MGSGVDIEGCIVGLSVGNGVVGSSEGSSDGSGVGSSDGLGVGCKGLDQKSGMRYYKSNHYKSKEKVFVPSQLVSL